VPHILLTGFVAPCQPVPVHTPPVGAAWLHEIKHDGFRLIVRRDGARVRLFTRICHDWAARYPVIVAAAAALQARSFLIDGEVVVADARGVASFDLLRGRARQERAFVWAFDLLELEARICALSLERRKDKLKALLKRAPFGLALNDYVAGDWQALFAQACAMGLEGIVAKRRSSPYRSGRSPHWLKAKNAESPAVRRETLEDWGRRRSSRF
jgi:ATP-dependent DNA ligase